jgi:hypothetical protein
MIAMLKTLPGVRTDQVEFAVFMTFSVWPGRRAPCSKRELRPRRCEVCANTWFSWFEPT